MNTAAIDIAENAEATIMVNSATSEDGIYGQYAIAKIRISPDNRKRFNEQALQELAESIKAVGVAQPILIRPVTPTADEPEEYEIVAGERRYRASKLAGKDTIPAVCRSLSNLDAAKLRILENLQREDPHPMEEAEGYQLLMMQHGLTADQLADEVKKSKAYVYARLKLCALAPEAREPFLNNEISASTALLIARIPVPKLQVQALKEVTATDMYRPEPMSVRAAAEHIQQKYMLDLKKAIFPLKDTKLLASAGSCVKCPKRAGNQPDIFQGIGADVCTDPGCFAEKKAAHFASQIVEANKKGIPVLDGAENNSALAKCWGHNDGEYVRGDAAIVHFPRNAPTTRNAGTVEKWLGAANMPSIAVYGKNVDGALVPLYRRADVQAALEAAGACETVAAHAQRMEAQPTQSSEPLSPAAAWPFPTGSRSPGNQATPDPAVEQAKRETVFRVELYKRLRQHGSTNGFGLQALRELTKLAVYEKPLPDDLLDIYQFDPSSDESICAYVDEAGVSEVQLLLIDLLVGELLSITQHDIRLGNDVHDSYRFVNAMAKHEGLDPAQVREELFPSPIDVSGLAADDLENYLKPRLARINEIKDAVIADRPDLVKAFERAANCLGYVFASGRFQLQESKQEGATPAAAEVATQAAEEQAQPDAGAEADPGLDDMAADAAGPAVAETTKPPAKARKSKKNQVAAEVQ